MWSSHLRITPGLTAPCLRFMPGLAAPYLHFMPGLALLGMCAVQLMCNSLKFPFVACPVHLGHLIQYFTGLCKDVVHHGPLSNFICYGFVRCVK
ncbi:hypothetical protein HAX54_041639 [Datura stramonium]|uniref:Secreted protein n=1 Tax=Datura stramonium TaxID=4076 RepID=A0ABS8VXF5_DATST|nr:hypothetical protein [Datura stramonium]